MFSYINPLLSLGYRRALFDSDLDELSVRLQAEHVYEKFQDKWDAEYASKGKDASLTKVFNQTFGWVFWTSGVLKVFSDALQFAGPFILQQLLVFVAETQRY